MDHNFSIAVAVEVMALAYEFRNKFFVVVYLSVVNQHNRFVFIEHWLISIFRKIYNAESSVAETYRVVNENAFTIRSAVSNSFIHFPNIAKMKFVFLAGVETAGIKDPVNSAHCPDYEID